MASCKEERPYQEYKEPANVQLGLFKAILLLKIALRIPSSF